MEQSRDISIWNAIAQDFARYRSEGVSLGLHVLLFCPGFRATCLYRVTHAWQARTQSRMGRLIVNQICHAVSEITGMQTHISLPSQAQIGPGLFVPHFGPVTVNAGARIGANCSLHPGVLIGQAGRGERCGVPVLGDRVYVGANAVIIGKIGIGDDAAIGAGAVVTRSVPARGVAVGNPARVISQSGSFDLTRYPGMESDPDRLASMTAADAVPLPPRNGRRSGAGQPSAAHEERYADAGS